MKKETKRIKELVYLCNEDNLHVKAHLNTMVRIGITPAFVFVLTTSVWKTHLRRLFPHLVRVYRYLRSTHTKENQKGYSIKLFGADLTVHSIFFFLRKSNIPYKVMKAKNVNDKKIKMELRKNSYQYVLSNVNGIVRKDLLDIGPKWINCHKGILPDYRGSSATYWAILTGGKFGATVHYMDEGIDTGAIIKRKEFLRPNIESVLQMKLYEAYMVTTVFRLVLLEWINNGPPEGKSQIASQGKSFYIMHPALAELARWITSKTPKTQSEYQLTLSERIKNVRTLEYFQYNVKQKDRILGSICNYLHSCEIICEIVPGRRFVQLVRGLANYGSKERSQLLDLVIKKWQKKFDVGWSFSSGIRGNNSLIDLPTETLIKEYCGTLLVYQATKSIGVLNTAYKISDEIWNRKKKHIPELLIEWFSKALVLQHVYVNELIIEHELLA